MAKFKIPGESVGVTGVWIEDFNTPNAYGDLEEGEVGVYIRDSDGDVQRIAHFDEDGLLHLDELNAYTKAAWAKGGGQTEAKARGKEYIKVSYD